MMIVGWVSWKFCRQNQTCVLDPILEEIVSSASYVEEGSIHVPAKDNMMIHRKLSM